jgi:hypothetical protein
MYVHRSGSLDEYGQALRRADGQCGAIVAIAGEIRCLDFVGRSDVFAGLYAKLLRGYALEAVERPLDRPLRKIAVTRFLAAINAKEQSSSPRSAWARKAGSTARCSAPS